VLESHRINRGDVIDRIAQPDTDLRGIKAVEALSISNRKIYRFRAIRRPGFLFLRSSPLHGCRPAGIKIGPGIYVIPDPVNHRLILLHRNPAPHRCNIHPEPPLKARIPLTEEQVPKRYGQRVMIRFLPMLIEIGKCVQHCHRDNRTIVFSKTVLPENRSDQTLGGIQFLLNDDVFIVRIDPEIFLCFIQ
jgi:hypothetical protein